jgi:UDP-N-acetylglucosamine--N-acetylmuramyl-(pentapeptide) pyrophosphoryl-undecaprenol N-acetylglucosamine transferase
MSPAPSTARACVAIACGGTGGHLFPGLAVGEELSARGVEVLYLVSPKEVDQQIVRSLPAEQVVTLPAVGLDGRGWGRFLRAFIAAWREARRVFRARPPAAVLAMGGFTSAPPVLAGRRAGAATFLHEGNSIPGRANRWLAHVVDAACVYFPAAAERLWHERVHTVGMPLREAFRGPRPDPAGCRQALGLRPQDPVLLVTGGSQGAHALNELMVRTLPVLRLWEPHLQVIHLTGPQDCETVRQAYAAQGIPALVRQFLSEMDLALGAASAVVGRAGASFLAETAALGVPALLVPYPFAADDHQYHNARAFADSGAARLVRQAEATPEKLVWELRALLRDSPLRRQLQAGLARWYTPGAAGQLAEVLAAAAARRQPVAPEAAVPAAPLLAVRRETRTASPT